MSLVSDSNTEFERLNLSYAFFILTYVHTAFVSSFEALFLKSDDKKVRINQ